MTAKAINVTPFSSIQDEYSLVVRDIEKELQPAAKAYNLGILPYFPLASGLLTGKYAASGDAPAGTRFALVPRLRDRYVNEKNVGIVEKLKAFATERGHSMLELAFSWLASRDQVSSVIAGATKPEQVEQNAKAVAWKMTPDETRRDRPDHARGISDGEAVIAERSEAIQRALAARLVDKRGIRSEFSEFFKRAYRRAAGLLRHRRAKRRVLRTAMLAMTLRSPGTTLSMAVTYRVYILASRKHGKLYIGVYEQPGPVDGGAPAGPWF